MATRHALVTLLLYCVFLGATLANIPPRVLFGPPAGNVFFGEDTVIGTHLFDITAQDSDSMAVTFETTNDETAKLVTIKTPTKSGVTWTAGVSLNAALDRDRSPSTRDLLFKVADEQSEIQGRVRLIITDVNDNPPSFINLPYRITLDEGTADINKTVLTAVATDPDDGPGGSVLFSMAAQAQGADERYNKTFVIPDENHGDIMLALELDYETRNYYQYQIYAKDRGNAACPGPECACNNVTEPNVMCEGEPATFIVTVRDVQDTPPYFEQLPYIAEVRENASVGTSFYQVSALDGDRGVPNDVTYSIVDASRYPFNMDASNGILSVAAPGLDADKPGGRSYIITVMASEVINPGEAAGGETNATTKVSITVHDVNDNSPRFAETVYHASVQENTPRGVPLTVNTTIEVSDMDQNENSQFVLSVEKDGQPYDAFVTLPGSTTTVQGMTTVMISVFNSSVLDYETTKNLTFQLRATETRTTERNSNTTTVILTITDMNDNSPVFSPDQPTAVNVTEHETPGVVLATFTATDVDSGNFGTVSYYLEDDNPKFAIDEQSGNLSVKADLDREEPGGSSYTLVVVAKDSPGSDENQRRSIRLTIRVTVLDINDNPPVFQPHPDSVTVQENASPGTALMTLTAIDKDSGLNGKVVYRLLSVQSPHSQSELFMVDENTGVVSVNASLIGYPGSHNVTFGAFDSAAEPQNATTTVTVFVQDVNINTPVFVVPDEGLLNTTLGILPNITITEEEPLGSLVLRLNATDKDTGDNGLVYYGLDPDLEGMFNYFAVDPLTGSLTNKQRLDRETNAVFQINIKAEDRGTPNRLSSVVPFRVLLRDINDNPPRFSPPAILKLSVGEETKDVKVGYVNIATDADHDPAYKIICYYVYGGEMVKSFYLWKNTGELRLLSELDRDVTPAVNLVVKAEEDCTLREDHFYLSGNHSYNDSDSSLLQVVVQVQDINDNPPVFDKDALTVGLLWDKAIGFEVINLVKFTRDEDSPVYSKNFYRLLKMGYGPNTPEEVSPPFIVSENGSVVTNRLFGAGENGEFVLTVEAYDKDNQTDVADVKIYLVSDFQRVKLVFNRGPNAVVAVKGELVRRLGQALGMTIIADKIATHITTDGKPDPERTDVFIHARRIPSGEIVPTSELWNAFDYNDEVQIIFHDLGVRDTLPVNQAQSADDESKLQKAFIIVAVVLSIVCLVLVLVLFSTIRRNRRRLRAATTSAFATRKAEPNNYVPPGTNRYFSAENPLFGKDVKLTDVDRLDSDNDSLDNNAVDGKAKAEKEKEEEQEMYLELFDEGNGQGVHVNHLAMVLQEYERENNGDGGEDVSSAPPYLTPSSNHDDPSDKWKSSLNGHAKSDSGFNEHGSLEHGMQYTDI